MSLLSVHRVADVRSVPTHTRIYFIRHGESEANQRQIFAGQTDVSLTPLGRRQAACTAEYLRTVALDAVYTSDLLRAVQTAQPVADSHGLPLRMRPALQEIHAGEWEGRPFTELMTRPDYRQWIQQIGLAHCAGGESVAELQSRIAAAVADIVRRHPGGTVCIVTHAAAIRTQECLWRGVPLAQMHTVPWVSNASVTVADYTAPDTGHLLARDIHAHLGQLETVLPPNV